MTKTLIPFIDLVTLLTLAFLFVGNIVGAIEGPDRTAESAAPPIARRTPAPPLATPTNSSRPHESEDRSLATREPRERQANGDDSRALAKAIEKARDALARLTEEVAILRARVEALRQRVTLAAAREEELRAIGPELAERTAELDRLEQEKSKHVQRLAELQAAALAEETSGTTTGAPVVQRDREAKQRQLLLVAGGRVFPLTRQYFTGQRVTGLTVAWPRDGQPGLTIEDALKPDSDALRDVTQPGFREAGRVTMLVNADSFDTFRVLRDALVKEGIDWGWEPHTGTRIVFSDTGKTIYSQAGRK